MKLNVNEEVGFVCFPFKSFLKEEYAKKRFGGESPGNEVDFFVKILVKHL